VSKIQKLPQELINIIAAGEVVERPASVVKELVENSIDAGSSKIIINVENGGLDLIEIIDDGIGISRSDSALVLEQHATSKVGSIDDLSQIFTLGFRGEALASISSVAEKTAIETFSKEEETSTSIRKDASGLKVEDGKTDFGTKIRIEGLFKPVPARLKFIKKISTENRNIISTFLKVALPYTDIEFELNIDGKQSHKLTKTTDFKTRIFESFNKNIAKNIKSYSAELPDKKIKGLFGNSFASIKQSKYQYVFINNRYIESSLIDQAVKQAYVGHIHRDLKPTYFIFIDLNPKDVDFNVHPRKLEIKFTNEREIFSQVYKATQKALENINEDSDEPEIKTPASRPKVKAESFKGGTSLKPKVKDALSFTRNVYVNEPLSLEQNEFVETKNINKAGQSPNNISPIQIFNTYILFEKQDQLFFIDQHAAAEKINFEKLIQETSNIKSKPLLIAEEYVCDNSESQKAIWEQREEIEKLGIKFEKFGQKSFNILEIPEIAEPDSIKNIFDDFLKTSEDLGIDVSTEIVSKYNVSKDIYLKIATIACHGSIRAGQRLNESEMLQIINDIEILEEPKNCPHGRPIIWKMKKSDVEKMFNRDM